MYIILGLERYFIQNFDLFSIFDNKINSQVNFRPI